MGWRRRQINPDPSGNVQNLNKSNEKPLDGCMQLIETIGFVILKDFSDLCTRKIGWGIMKAEKTISRL